MAYTIHCGLQNFVERGAFEVAIKILHNKCYRIDITGQIPPSPKRHTVLPFPCLLLLNDTIRYFVAKHLECDTVVSYIMVTVCVKECGF